MALLSPSEDGHFGPIEPIDQEDLEAALKEPLDHVLDVGRWQEGGDLYRGYVHLEQTAGRAISQELRYRQLVREYFFPLLLENRDRLPQRGHYVVSEELIRKVQEGLLFPGHVEAVYGTDPVHDSIPFTVVQIGICLVSYKGDQGMWGHRIYRREMTVTSSEPEAELLEYLEQLRRRGGRSSLRDQVSNLARRGIRAFAERAFLVYKSKALWRIGRGHLAPYELLTGAGLVQSHPNGSTTYPLLRRSLEVLRELALEHRRFIFIPARTDDRMALVVGYALRPYEYAVLNTDEERLENIVAEGRGHYPASERSLVQEFAEEVGPQIVHGVYRASELGPPRIFYAHRDYVHQAALVAIADSVLQESRSLPVLLDLAETVCRNVFGVAAFRPTVQVAYADAGEPWLSVEHGMARD